MRIPRSTYRIQFHSEFQFEAARNILAYLAELGISDLYASPIFKATPGSTHGYDVVDPTQLNPELGTPEDFEALVSEIKNHDMGWVQDIVPNHMAYHSQNAWLMDVLENGLDSIFLTTSTLNGIRLMKTLRGECLPRCWVIFMEKLCRMAKFSSSMREWVKRQLLRFEIACPNRILWSVYRSEFGTLSKRTGKASSRFSQVIGYSLSDKKYP
jgi:(1->4)-alpha-D-glucan 1-alpha-D-glucosylmutase